MAEGKRVGRRIVGLFGERLAHFLFGRLRDLFSRVPAHLPLDAVLVVDGNEGAGGFLIGARRHGVEGKYKLVDAPERLAAAEGSLGTVGKASFAVEYFDVLGRFLHSGLVRGPLLRGLLFIHLLVR